MVGLGQKTEEWDLRFSTDENFSETTNLIDFKTINVGSGNCFSIPVIIIDGALPQHF